MDGLIDVAFFLAPIVVLIGVLALRRSCDEGVNVSQVERFAAKDGGTLWGCYGAEQEQLE